MGSILELFEAEPAYRMDVMVKGQNLGSLFTRLSASLQQALNQRQFDAVLVQGDTTSAMIAASLAFYAKLPVAHVEAGLRTSNVHTPFPEEFNRRVISLAARWHFAPTDQARANLAKEDVCEHVYVVGNTVVDAALWVAGKETKRVRGLRQKLPFLGDGRQHVLVTTHRRENFGAGLQQIAAALQELASRFSEISFVLPVHPNPMVREGLLHNLCDKSNVYLVEPLEYDELIFVLRTARAVLTDSGGIQEEAPIFNIPVLVMREETERPEGVRAGCTLLVGARANTIVDSLTRVLTDPTVYNSMANAPNPFGDGFASGRIADILEEALSN